LAKKSVRVLLAPIAETKMTLSMRRIVLFTKDMPGMTAFYRDVLGLKVRKDEKGWKEFDANGCVIALQRHLRNWPASAQDRLLGQGHRGGPPGAGRPRRQDVQADGRWRAGPMRGQGSRRQPLLDLRSSLITLQKWPN
jgi:catechol 2,3-dioxygenase-like lactoylglutathione lyase family enzyme